MTDNKKDPKRDVEPWRKFVFYLGTILTGIGFILFFSTFFRVFFMFSNFSFGDDSSIFNPFGGMGVSFIGFFMIFIGQIMRGIGRSGLAGSGILLNPKKEREDLEPFSRSKGGMVSDAYDEFKSENKETLHKVMVRCPHCKTLNDEDAKYCDNCGKEL